MFRLAFLLAASLPVADETPVPETVRVAARSACLRIVMADGSRSGTAVVVGRRGAVWYALTAAHVLGKGELHAYRYPPATFPKPAAVLRDVDVAARFPELDLAVLRIAAGTAELAPLSWAVAERTGKDEPFAALGVGCNDEGVPECRSERVLGKKLLRRADGTTCFVWETDAKPSPGYSGGPLLDREARLIGICNGAQDGKGYYCHLDEIRAALKAKNLAWLWEEKKNER